MELAFEIKEGLDGLAKADILSLYESVGWRNYTKNPDALATAPEISSSVVTSTDKRSEAREE